MAQYIDKSDLVKRIEKIIPGEPYPRTSETLYGAEKYGKREMCFKILDLINALEVKEADLDKEIELYWKQCDLTWCNDAYTMTHIRAMLSDIAKHFVKVGLKAKGE